MLELFTNEMFLWLVKVSLCIAFGGEYCCDIGQFDIFFRIELFPLSSLSSDNTNCKNDIPLFHQLFDELSVYRDYH